jgi:hypothetical protein
MRNIKLSSPANRAVHTLRFPGGIELFCRSTMASNRLVHQQPQSVSIHAGLSKAVCFIAPLWLLAAVGGGWCMMRYSTRPGPAIYADSRWPAGDRLRRAAGLYTLVMILHPNCPCSRASIDELEVLMTRCRDQLKTLVLFADAPGLVEDSTASDLWKSTSRIPGVVCRRDQGGKLSACFGARTSGQVFLYDAAGTLRFDGGLTTSRGHAGDSDGLLAITAVVSGQEPSVKHTPVFGCSIR